MQIFLCLIDTNKFIICIILYAYRQINNNKIHFVVTHWAVTDTLVQFLVYFKTIPLLKVYFFFILIAMFSFTVVLYLKQITKTIKE